MPGKEYALYLIGYGLLMHDYVHTVYVCILYSLRPSCAQLINGLAESVSILFGFLSYYHEVYALTMHYAINACMFELKKDDSNHRRFYTNKEL